MDIDKDQFDHALWGILSLLCPATTSGQAKTMKPTAIKRAVKRNKKRIAAWIQDLPTQLMNVSHAKQTGQQSVCNIGKHACILPCPVQMTHLSPYLLQTLVKNNNKNSFQLYTLDVE